VACALTAQRTAGHMVGWLAVLMLNSHIDTHSFWMRFLSDHPGSSLMKSVRKTSLSVIPIQWKTKRMKIYRQKIEKWDG